MPELLIELFSEEIPARMQARAAQDLQKLVQAKLFDAGFMPEGAKAFATPRRLTLVLTGLAVAQPDRQEERKGPRVGAPEQALAGFLKSAGLTSVDNCEIRNDKKGDYYVVVRDERGKPTAEVIAAFMPELIRKFPWPKAMRWGDGDLRWVRPLHSILCVFNNEIVPFEIGGIASGDITYGHRFMAPEPIQVRSFDAYEEALGRAKVRLDSAVRIELIEGEARGLCAAQGLELLEDKALLTEVAGLAEWPVVMIGHFDEKFLTVPDEALIAAMKGHQKYFSVRDPKTGRLANRFINVANIEASDGGAAMREGYERVLTARLSDAWFVYQQDLKIPLEEQAEKLAKITFFAGLGSVADKAERVAVAARAIAPMVGADPALAERAARLAKADLVTGMVGEFASLQGVMGRYYAREQGEPAQVADAIRDHYKPAGQNDTVPNAPVSVAVALAEKIDTLTAFWVIDQKPTGSKDPFALRRAALGVIQIILAGDVRLHLGDLIDGAANTLLARVSAKSNSSWRQDLLSFFHERLKVWLREQGHAQDFVDAVRHKADGSPEDDLVLIVKKLKALETMVRSDDGENLLAAYKRASNILKAEAKKDGRVASAIVAAENLPEEAEQTLYTALTTARNRVEQALTTEDFANAMAALAALRAPLDQFFEQVTVNTEEPALRENRLALLALIKKTCEQVVDLSKIGG